jgi:hypothetical protein
MNSTTGIDGLLYGIKLAVLCDGPSISALSSQFQFL